MLQGRLVPVKQLAGSIDIGNIGISTHIDAAHRPVTTHLRSAIKIAHRGTQNHHFTPASLAQEFHAAFGHALST